MAIIRSNVAENQGFEEESYQRHASWYSEQFPDLDQRKSILQSFKKYQGSINHWLQQQFFNGLTPLLADKAASWLTLGDAYGHDAQYILGSGVTEVTASDLNADFLALAVEEGLINQYIALNAESMYLDNNSKDYILCKESYHHFPRPYAALYEMIRVARKAIVLMEPQDPIARMPLLLMLSNISNRINQGWLKKIWKNRFSYEPVGNFVYKLSEREMEKFCAGINIPMLAVREFNPNFWFHGSNLIAANKDQPAFKKVLFRKRLRDLLAWLGLFPFQTLGVIIFKEIPNEQEQEELKRSGYRITRVDPNPYRMTI